MLLVFLTVFQMRHRVHQFAPGSIQTLEKDSTLVGQFIILSGWSLCGLLPFIRKQSVLLETGQQALSGG